MINKESKLSFNSVFDLVYDYAAKNGFKLIIGFALLVFVSTFLLRLSLVFTYIADMGGVESNVIYSIQRLIAGYPLYVDPSVAPYSITQYTPIYYYIMLGLAKLVQLDADQVEGVYILSRSFSLLCNLGFAYFSALITVNIFKGNRWMGVLVFVFAFVFLDEESYSRPDSLYNLMLMATVYLTLKFLAKEENVSIKERYLIGASLLSVLTIYVKQSGIFMPVLIVFFLLFYCQNVRWTLLSLITMGVSFMALLFLFAGNNLAAFYENVVQGVNNGTSVRWFIERILIEHFQKERFINIIGFSLGVYWLVKGKEHTLRFLGLAMLGAFLFGIITGFKIGAAPNYFTEFIALTVVATLVFVQKYDRLIANKNALYHAPPFNFKILFYFVLVVMTLLPRFVGKIDTKVIKAQQFVLGEEGYQKNKEIADYLYNTEKLMPEDKVFITTHVHDYLNKFLYKNTIFPQKEIVYRNPEGVYNYETYFEGLQDGGVKYIIASIKENNVMDIDGKAAINEDFLNADYSNYTAIKEMNGYVIFKHNRAF
ncbi:hypothetical protein PZB74_02205 [Porifericola rhodea]|uniref:hypothetical protein n=1 Tax=Porifericola rhodea TaxID=930972 RepID=UPI0026652236|nr:hypothetical protein [Porifericola rhodea]WKN32166.1 hypothetical protein PZB74_02205 [Porifericola rhodea]